MPATLGYRCEALLIIYIPAFFSWLRLRQRRIHSTTPRGIPPLTSQDKAGGGFGGAKIRLLLRRKPRLRKDWGMPIGYGRMLDGYVIELGGHWQAHGQGSLGRGLLHLKLDHNHWWIFSWLFHWKHHPSAMARLAELRSQPLPLAYHYTPYIYLSTLQNPPFQNAATQQTQTWLGRKIWLAERGISMKDIFFMWAWHLDEVRADTVWVKDYDIYGILGVEVGYWKNGTFWGFGFFLEFIFFAAPFWVAFIFTHPSIVLMCIMYYLKTITCYLLFCNNNIQSIIIYVL